MNKDNIIIAKEFGIYPSVKTSEEDALNLILKSIEEDGLTEKDFLVLNREAKKLVFDNTDIFSVDYQTDNPRMRTILSASGECYGTSYQKMNHGCVGCFAKKMCKKETAKIKEVEIVPETIESISDEKLIKTVIENTV